MRDEAARLAHACRSGLVCLDGMVAGEHVLHLVFFKFFYSKGHQKGHDVQVPVEHAVTLTGNAAKLSTQHCHHARLP